MARESRAVWAKRVERWRDSGLTAKEFAAEVGINASTLTYWKWQLGKDAKAAPQSRPRTTRKRRRAGERSAPKPSFVEITPPTAQPPSPLVLELVLCGDRTLRVPAGFDETMLTRVVRAVEAAR